MRPAPARRAWAWLALAALAALLASVAAVAARHGGSMLGLVGTALLSVVVAVAAAWWSLTTRKAWKRWLNLAVVALLAGNFVFSVVSFSLLGPGGVLAIVLSALAYAFATRRALTGGPPPARTWAQEPAGQPPASPWLLINPRSGDGTAGRTGLVAAAEARGLDVHLLVQGDDPVALARKAVADGADALGVAGGDGTLGLVAAVAVEAGVPFVCVPAGTRNHFAHDLGLDRTDPVGALDAFAGVERRIDVGLVGDRVFLNNVSLGAYADVVAEEGYRARKLATARIVLRASVRGERAPLAVAFRDTGGNLHKDVLVLLVANNRYQLERPAELGARDRLDDGVLQVSSLQARTGAALAGIVLRAVAGRVIPGSTWAQWEATELHLDTGLAHLPAGVDGESVMIAPPLEFRSLPKALRMLVPDRPGPSPSSPPPLSRLALRRLWAVATGRGRWAA